jgi:hypothetical protein
MHKQLFGLKDQIGLIRRELRKVKQLEAKAPKAAPGANFGEKMTAKLVGLSLSKSRKDLEEVRDLLQVEIDFYVETDAKLAQLQAAETPDAEAVAQVTKDQADREGGTAALGAYAMQVGAAVQVVLFKVKEKDRAYRD